MSNNDNELIQELISKMVSVSGTSEDDILKTIGYSETDNLYDLIKREPLKVFLAFLSNPIFSLTLSTSRNINNQNVSQ